jgi:hypothetical protein
MQDLTPLGDGADILAKQIQIVRWNLRRWTPKHLWYRARLPVRRRRWATERNEQTKAFAKSAAACQTTGPALAFGEFAGSHGLGRAAAYDVGLLRQRHSSVTTIDIGPFLRGQRPAPIDTKAPIENVYFFCQPDSYGTVCGLLRPDWISGAWRVGRWVWETPLFPEDWRFAEALVHEIWAPSEFCASTFRAALNTSVKVIPHTVTPPPDTGIDMRRRLGVP